MQIKRLFLLGILFSFYGCSTAPPSEQEVKDLVNAWYTQQAQSDGAGNWEVKGITVLSIKKDPERKGVFNTSSLATGTYRYPPLAEPKPDEPFTDTVRMDLEWNGSKWVSAKSE